MYKEYNSIQTDTLLGPVNNKLIKRKINYSAFFIYFILLVIFTIQVFNFVFVYKIAITLEKFNSINIDEVNSYINKTKHIVDYVCSDLITC